MDKLFYGMLLTGLMLTFFPSIEWLLWTLRIRMYFRRNFSRFEEEEKLKIYGKLGSHLRMLIHAAEVEPYFPTIERFYLVSGGISLCTGILLSTMVPLQQAVMWSVFMAGLPYLVLQLQLYEKRVRRSREGDILVQELLNQYQICDYHMAEALEQTALSLEEEPMGRRLFLQLSKELRNAVTKQEVEGILNDFRYAFDTVWGNVLASNILFAHLYGVRVDSALKDLLYCMVQSRKSVEYSRRENHEARMMLLWLTPISYLLSVSFACHFFDFSVGKFFSYQLETPLGLQWFLSMVFCYVVSLLVHGFLAKEKMDI